MTPWQVAEILSGLGALSIPALFPHWTYRQVTQPGERASNENELEYIWRMAPIWFLFIGWVIAVWLFYFCLIQALFSGLGIIDHKSDGSLSIGIGLGLMIWTGFAFSRYCKTWVVSSKKEADLRVQILTPLSKAPGLILEEKMEIERKEEEREQQERTEPRRPRMESLCWSCGTEKKAPLAKCPDCGQTPGSLEEIISSITLDVQAFTDDQILAIRALIKKNGAFDRSKPEASELLKKRKARITPNPEPKSLPVVGAQKRNGVDPKNTPAAWYERRRLLQRPSEYVIDVPQKITEEVRLDALIYGPLYNKCVQLSSRILHEMIGEPPSDSDRDIRLSEFGVEGVRLLQGDKLHCSYRGDAHGGRTNFHWLVDGELRDLKDGIIVDRTIQGFTSIFFLMWELTTLGAYWHGLYDFPKQYFHSDDDLLFSNLRDREGRKSDDDSLNEVLTIPTTIRVMPKGECLRVSCLASKVNVGVIDCWLDIDSDGHVRDRGHDLVRATGIRTLF